MKEEKKNKLREKREDKEKIAKYVKDITESVLELEDLKVFCLCAPANQLAPQLNSIGEEGLVFNFYKKGVVNNINGFSEAEKTIIGKLTSNCELLLETYNITFLASPESVNNGNFNADNIVYGFGSKGDYGKLLNEILEENEQLKEVLKRKK